MSQSTASINWTPMIVGLIAGFVSRILALRGGQSHYPGYPSGYVSQIALAIIAAMIGSTVVVALMAKEFTAATFLTLAATQFRDVRTTERKTLEQEETLLLVGRGAGYIEGIASTYEARNYLAMLVALAASAATEWTGTVPGIALSLVLVVVGQVFMSGPKVGQFIDVHPVPIRFEQTSLLYAGPVMMMEVGLPHTRERYVSEGLAVLLVPKNPRGQAILWNLAQRQAIVHEAASAVGAAKDVGYPERTPLCRMAMPEATGQAGLTILPVEHNIAKLISAIQNTPVLESGKWSKLTRTKPGDGADRADTKEAR